MIRRPATALLAFLALLPACPRVDPVPDGLAVSVTRPSGSNSRCVLFTVSPPTGPARQSGPIAATSNEPLRVAVLRDPAFGETVTLLARGYADDGCTTLTRPGEASKELRATFVAGEVVPISLTMEKAPAIDQDGDGHAPKAAGGDDCDDDDPAVHPGAVEDCTNARDDDCDLQRDCADSACAGQACLNGGTCAAGFCAHTSSETGLCDDGHDNDGDKTVDCFDSDCLGLRCDDADACRTGETCAANGACAGGTQVTCNDPPSSCFLSPGVCQSADGSCLYPPATGANCDDNSACTTGDKCSATGACEGKPVHCNTPPACATSIGVCNTSSGKCEYGVTPSASCDDGDNCTTGDTCDAQGTCKGTRVTCPTPTVCLEVASSCTPSGVCQYTPVKGKTCPAGHCDGTGTCVPTLFPYTPSNFTEAQMPDATRDVVLNCGETVINTTTSGADPQITNWCQGNDKLPSFQQVPSTAGAPALMLAMRSLSLAAGSTLKVIGGRPLILAVAGDVALAGAVLSNGTGLVPGAGGSLCTAAAGRGVDGSANLTGGGGGGGAFATEGARGGQGADAAGGEGGAPVGSVTNAPLLGGCSGGRGGGGSGGAGGVGGGALQISASGNIRVTGYITTSGGGGRGSQSASGGGGGGSGGAILLEANNLILAGAGAAGTGGTLTANGGGGGGGAGVVSSNVGAAGADGAVRTATAASGGSGPAGGASGGNGGARQAAPKEGDQAGGAGGGGGGGGAVGRIRLNIARTCTFETGALVSPRATSAGDSCP